MDAAVWAEIRRDLDAVRSLLLDSPLKGLPAAEDTLERVRQRWKRAEALPGSNELAELCRLLAEIRFYCNQAAELVDGWRYVLGSLAGEYDAGGAPANHIFATHRISRVG